MPEYEIRPHHAFKGWVLVFRNGINLCARTSRLEAEQYIARQKQIESLKERRIQL